MRLGVPLKFHPNPGTILLCNYETGFRIPEMVKERPAIVVSPRLRRRDNLCAVVPLSLTPPITAQNYHYELTLARPLPSPWANPTYWVKADMLATVGFQRLNLIRIGKDQEGKRKYLTSKIPVVDLRNIRVCILNALGMSSLTSHL